MKLMLDSVERKNTYYELKTEYLFIILPFILLISYKSYIGKWEDILYSSDWSLASCLMFGQTTVKMTRAISKIKMNSNEYYFGWYATKRFLYVIFSITAYFGMIANPTVLLGVIQILIFIFASYFHFKDGFTTKLLKKNNS
ncbi:hypothetical protein WKG84_12655 [Pantoea agglomerans]|uniref:hypothetical protein n=1 Tax=Pantoea TaxID=53335 RepID=UPI00351CCC25